MAVMKYWDGTQWVKMPFIAPSPVMSVNGKSGIVNLEEVDIPNLVDDLGNRIIKPVVAGDAGQVLAIKADGTTEWKTVSTDEPTYVAASFSTSSAYGVGDYVFYNNELYKAKSFIPAGAFNPTQWNKVKVMDELRDQEIDLRSIAPTFDKAASYAKDDFVIYQNSLYKARVNKAAGTDFVPANWEAHSVTGLIKDSADEGKDTLNDISDEYSTVRSYATGDYCTHEGILYRANSATSGTFNASKWDAVSITGEVEKIHGSIAPAFSEAASYNAGDFVVYLGDLYKAKTAITPGSFNPTKWDKTNIASNLYDEDHVNNLCSEWSTTGYYAGGTMVMHEGKLYILVVASSTIGTWKPSEWHEVKAVDQLVDMFKQFIVALGVKMVPSWDGTKIVYNFETNF